MSPGEALSEVVGENVVLRSLLREQRKIHSTLRHMNGRLRSFLATVPGVLYSFHPSGSLDYISPSVEGLLGKPDTWYLADSSRYLDQIHPDMADVVQSPHKGGHVGCARLGRQEGL